MLALPDIDLRLYDPHGILVGQSDASDENVERFSLVAEKSGEYLWEAYGFDVPAGQGGVVVAFAVESSPADSCMSGAGIPLGSKGMFRSLQACAALPEAEAPPVDVPDAEYLEYLLAAGTGPLNPPAETSRVRRRRSSRARSEK